MSSEPERTTKVVSEKKQPYSVQINRLSKGNYTWTIKAETEKPTDAVLTVENVDRMLRYKFLGEPPIKVDEKRKPDANLGDSEQHE